MDGYRNLSRESEIKGKVKENLSRKVKVRDTTISYLKNDKIVRVYKNI